MERRRFLISCASAALARPALASGVELPTKCSQGAVLRGRTAPGAAIRIEGGLAFQAAADGHFIVGLGRNAPAHVRVSIAGAEPISREIEVAKRNYLSVVICGTARQALASDPQSASAPDEAFGAYRGEDLFDGGDPTTDYGAADSRGGAASQAPQKERLAKELARKRKAWLVDAPIGGFSQTFIWPTRGRISSHWGAERILVTKAGERRPSRPHAGVDIAAVTGTPVRAPADGVVALAASDFFYEGGVVFLSHGQGLTSVYLHMSRVDCREGDTVRQGDRIGAVGAGGRATGPHLCWRMRWRGVDVDPSSLVPAMA